MVDDLIGHDPFYLYASWTRHQAATAAVYVVSSFLTAYLCANLIGHAQLYGAPLLFDVVGLLTVAVISVGAHAIQQRWTRVQQLDLSFIAKTEPGFELSSSIIVLGLLQTTVLAGKSFSVQLMPFLLSQVIDIFIAPVLVLLSPYLRRPLCNFKDGGQVSALTALIGVSLQSSVPSSLGTLAATCAFASNALFMGLVKRWQSHTNLSTGNLVFALSCTSALFSAVVLLPFLKMVDTSVLMLIVKTQKRLFLPYTLCYAIHRISFIKLLCEASSPLEVALLAIPQATMACLHKTESGFIQTSTLVLALIMACAAWMYTVYTGYQMRHHVDDGSLPLQVQSPLLDAEKEDQHVTGHHTTFPRLLTLFSLLPFAYWTKDGAALSDYMPALRQTGQGIPTLDIVLAYYNEPLDEIIEQLNYVRSLPNIVGRAPTFITYVKGTNVSLEDFQQQTGVDQIYTLPNFGREGDTYLYHILRNYNASQPSFLSNSFWRAPDKDQYGALSEPRGLADQTIFLQNHLSWSWVSQPRMKLFSERTGYLAFGPYLKLMCGSDSRGNGEFVRAREIYAIFTERFCAPEGQLAAYAAQFAVSKKRILKHSYQKYAYLRSMMHAASDHWLHEDAHGFSYAGASSPTNPFLGHALERSWPVIMGCNDIRIAEECTDDVADARLCQCID